ncbi:MAG: hypothetical protein RJQ10_14320 [Haliea sp.]|uniref:hypothetical protein n=1 Tax=Haliea sp. TaxID=1932666 RepID=UPI0032EED195
MPQAAAGPSLHCVLLPCSSGATWVVPLNSIAEVLVAGEVDSGRLRWRDCELPVYPPPEPGAGRGVGIYAVMRGLRDLAGGPWAVSLRNTGLVHRGLTEADCSEPAPGYDNGAADTLAAFGLAGSGCVVPDLGALQEALASAPAHPAR